MHVQITIITNVGKSLHMLSENCVQAHILNVIIAKIAINDDLIYGGGFGIAN